MGHTENSIIINKDINKVFDITNRIEIWKDLFSEYKESTILKQEGNRITFRLTTHPDEEGRIRSWVSLRIIDKEHYTCDAHRLDPADPFEFMNLKWHYKEVEKGTEMTWIQDFKPMAGCPWNDRQFEDYINKNSKKQMQVIKENIENKTIT
jgi:aromatase